MAGEVKNFVAVLTAEQGEELHRLLDERGWNFSQVPYSRWKATREKVNVVLYLSGKLTVQGGGTADFVRFTLEPEILHTFSFDYPELAAGAAAAEEDCTPHGGVDESGKGDFFGPLCVAGVFVDELTAPRLRAAGCCDSKLIKSSARIFEISGKIRAIVGDGYALVNVGNGSYNELYSRIGNLNRLLAWGHARVIENLLEKAPQCPRMLSDKFGNELLIKRSLMERGRKIKLDQRTKAESDVAVAAASILAREQFLKGMARLEEQFGMKFPRGAGPAVKEAGELFISRHGAAAMKDCAKLHFKTYNELIGGV